MRVRFVVPLLALTACMEPNEPTRFSGPAIDALVTLPPAQLEATLRIAEEVANGCENYSVSTPMKYALLAERDARGLSSVSSAGPQAVTIETDVVRRSFQAKYDIVIGESSTCSAIASEIAEKTAFAAVIFPA